MKKIVLACGVCALVAFSLLPLPQKAQAASTATVINPYDPCIAFSMPTRDQIFAAKKKVFAHYFNRFPMSIDGKPANVDYYTTQFLSPMGENGKWIANGGYLRDRPMPVANMSNAQTFVLTNMENEVKLAMARGITGFTFDILGIPDVAPGGYLMNMLQAANAVDTRFKIILMPDMASMGPNIENVVQIVDAVYDQPGLYRMPDGRPVVAPFLSESVTPAQWEIMEKELADQGKPIAFFPTFLSMQPQYFATYGPISVGLGTFGTPYTGNQIPGVLAASSAAHAMHLLFMDGISPQSYRPKSFIYWEAKGSTAYREGWNGAISGNADWIQLTTWNDLSESTEIIPYSDTAGTSGTGYYDLTGYYATWFLTGKAPLITHDVLYYFYRKQSIASESPKAAQATVPAPNTAPGADLIEVVAFLTAPGTVSVTIGGKTYSQTMNAGMQAFRTPLIAGTPRFTLTRGPQTVLAFNGSTQIYGKAGLPDGFSDMTYWSGSSSISGVCTPASIWGSL